MRRIMSAFGVVIVGFFAFVLLSCEKGHRAASSEDSPGEVQSQRWPDEAQRLVSMAPNITEALFALGYGDRVVAVTRYCDFPAQAQDLPKIGGMLDPDLEAILKAEPDLVLGDIQGADHRIATRLDRAGVAYGFLKMDDLDAVRAGLLTLGRWLGDEAGAKELLARFESELSASSKRARASRVQAQERALLIYDHEPVVAAGPGSFGDDLLELAGLKNVLEGSERAYPVLDVEALLSLDPDLILDVGVGRDKEEARRFWERQQGLRAVRDGQVISIDDPVLGRPGPRLPQALDLLGEALQESDLSASEEP